jgi:hypothetical protein
MRHQEEDCHSLRPSAAPRLTTSNACHAHPSTEAGNDEDNSDDEDDDDQQEEEGDVRDSMMNNDDDDDD